MRIKNQLNGKFLSFDPLLFIFGKCILSILCIISLIVLGMVVTFNMGESDLVWSARLY